MLGGELAVLQAPMFDGLSLDPFSLFDDVAGPAEVGVSGRHVLQALVVTPVIVVFDERLDLGFEVTRQEVVFQQDAVLHGLVPALDLALRLGMERRTAHMAHTLGFDVFSQLAGDVAGSIVRQQARSVMHVGRRTARGNQRKIQRIGDVLGPHRAAQLPGDYVARVIVEHGRQVHPAPPDDLEVGEVGLPHLVHPLGLGAEVIRPLITAQGGHGTLMRADQSVRAAVEVFEPLSAPLLQLTQGLKRTFDPFNALNAGRMYEAV
jgi:hypothetical protein